MVESFVQPSSPLASSSRAVASFHAKHGHFPDGERDKVRFLDGEHATTGGATRPLPVLDGTSLPVLVNDALLRAVVAGAAIERGLDDVERGANVDAVSRSIACRSVDGALDPGMAGMLPERDWSCIGGHLICHQDKMTTIVNGNFSSIEMIPACTKKLEQLKELHLPGNQIAKIENLDELVGLKELYLGGNWIEDIENLDGLESLEYLYLSRNRIKKIENLDGLTGLKELDLDYNKIAKIEGLDELASLEKLYLDNNQIAKIENLDGLASLEELYLSRNQIKDIEGVDNLERLEVLKLSRNPVPDDEIEAFRRTRPSVNLILY